MLFDQDSKSLMRTEGLSSSSDTIVHRASSDNLSSETRGLNSKKIYIAASKKYFVPIDTSECRTWLDFTTLLLTNSRLNLPFVQCIPHVYNVNTKDGSQDIVSDLDDLKDKAFYFIPYV
ncbi:hypothetical protein HDV06_004656 [Boothiomyces sp. JEL0866]|nr:hypothetical protein HDV06_004656 [Boothiomyces sp. JEL0866]